MKRIVMTGAAIVGSIVSILAQIKPADTLVIKVGQASKVIFAIQDKKDLEILKKYNFQALVEDMIVKLEKKDTSKISQPSPAWWGLTTRGSA